MSVDDKNNSTPEQEKDWSIDWSESDELDFFPENFEDEDIESQFWAPYAEQHPEEVKEITASNQSRSEVQTTSAVHSLTEGVELEYDEEDFTERELLLSQKERFKEEKHRRNHLSLVLRGLIYVVFVAGASVLFATVGWIMANDVLALNKTEITLEVEITEETELDELVQQLNEEGIISYTWLFKLYCTFTGSLEELTLGSYEVNTNMDYHALCSALSSSSTNRATVSVTIPEGYTVDQIFELLVEKGVCETVEELQEIAATHDYAFDFLAEIPLGDYHRLEGYLFPDTYTFYVGHDPLYVINKMLVNFDSQFTKDMKNTAESLGYSIYEILTVASIIEKETNGSDMRNIAAVIYNRLATNETLGRLQMDSTIQYVLERTGIGRKEELESDDFSIDSPYNTYLYSGLPEGPICNPSLSSIRAALSPNDVTYLYYFHDNAGKSHFYTSYADFVSDKELYLSGNYVEEEEEINYEEFEDVDN